MKPSSSYSHAIGAIGVMAAFCLGSSPALADDPAEWQGRIPLSELEATRAQGVDGQDIGEVSAISGATISIDGLEASNRIDGGAFAGSSGFVNVLQNNGNGAIVSNTMNVVVTIHPGPSAQ